MDTPPDSEPEPREEPEAKPKPEPAPPAPSEPPPQAPPKGPSRRELWSEGLGEISRAATLAALIAIGVAVWAMFAFGGHWVPAFLISNDLPMPARMRMIKVMVGAGVVGGLAGGALYVVGRRKGWERGALESVLWFLSPLILLGFLPQLFRAKPWANRQDVLVPLVFCFGLAVEVIAFQSLVRVPARVTRLIERAREKLPSFWKKHGALTVVLLATTFYVVFMSFYNLRWHYKLKTHNFDLSIDNNLIYAALKTGKFASTVTQGNHPGQYLATHAKLGQYLILPIYALYPKPETLIVIQSLFLGLGALPLFGFARRRVSDWTAVLIALAYLGYPPLHSANFTESKYLSLSCVFVLATFWAVDRKKWVLFGLFFVAATLMREDVPVGLAIAGAFMLLSGYRPMVGLGMAIVSTAWFLYLRSLMDKTGSWWFPGMYKGIWAKGEEGYSSVLKTLITNPLFVLDKIITRDKVMYLMHLLVPVVFLPARRWWLWLAFIPGALLTLLVTDYKPIYGYSFQYVMHWVPYIFLAVPLALQAIAKAGENGPIRARAAVTAMGLSAAALSYNYGAFARRPESVKGGYFYIDFTFSEQEKKRYNELQSVIAEIPPEASVVATEMIGPQVSSRRYMYALRRGVYDAEYILAARNELDFEQTRKLFTHAVKSNEYGVVKRVGDFVLLQKGHDPSGNAALIRDWKL
jgi:uncharacterized membrane protein